MKKGLVFLLIHFLGTNFSILVVTQTRDVLSESATLNEGILLSVLKCIFPSHSIRLFNLFSHFIFLPIFILYKIDIVVNTRKEASNKYPDSGNYLELDFWIPDLNLCFEFQVNILRE
jgi:hypothetical protein